MFYKYIPLRFHIANIVSYFHTSAQNNVQVKAMRKLLGKNDSKKKKHRYCDTPILPSPDSFSKGAFEGNHSGNTRRVAVLNKLFMRHITDLMVTGSRASEFSGLGIEINRVKITPDYKLVQIFWVAKGTSADESVEQILSKNAGYIRHELTQLRVIGMVPKIQFFKDKFSLQLMEVEARLEKADFGEDYVPVDPADRLKAQLELNTVLDPEIREQIEKHELEVNEQYENPLPPMPQNVFGLDHDRIMKRVKQALNRSKATHRNVKIEDSGIETANLSTNTDIMEFPSEISQKEAFRKFLLQRQLLKRKLEKDNKNYSADLEYLKAEMEERHKQNFEQFFVENDEEDDAIDEIEDDLSK